MDRDALYGTFNARVKTGKGIPGHFYTLTLFQDSTFSLDIKVHMGNSGCKGKWTATDDKVVLHCNKPKDAVDVLTRGNVATIEKLQIINKNKLKYKQVVLKRE